MMIIRACTILALTLLLAAPGTASAGPGKGKDNEKSGKEKNERSPKRTRIKETLRLSLLAPSDLSSANGRVDYDGKVRNRKGSSIVQRQLKLRVRLPIASSIGIADAASAALLPVTLEVLREGAAVHSCQLAFQEPELDAPTQFSFRLHAHVNPKGRAKLVKGSCTGEVPTLSRDDHLRIFATVGDQQVELLEGGAQLAAPTPTPAPTP